MTASSRTEVGSQSPRDLYRAGHLSECLRALHGIDSPEATFLRICALIRSNRPEAALAEMSELPCDTDEDDVYRVALRLQCAAMMGNHADVLRDLAIAKRLPLVSAESRAELAYARAYAGFTLGSAEEMESALLSVVPGCSAQARARILYMRSWRAAMRLEYVEQVRLLEHAVTLASSVDGYDVPLLASCARALTHAVREIFAVNTYEVAVRLVDRIEWTPDLASQRFYCLRALAWAHALRGWHRDASRLMCVARDAAPSQRWIAACYADQAYLARMAGGGPTADAFLEHAISLAHRVEWDTPGEDRVALLTLMELAADVDVAASRSLLSIYDSIRVGVSPTLSLRHDVRLKAMQDHARGTVLVATGRMAEGVALLQDSYGAFVRIRYAWRASASALRLHAATGNSQWLKRAQDAVADFPESSVAQEIRRLARGSSDPRYAELTDKQRHVFRLMCSGLSDRAIADEMKISVNTAKNHGAAIRAAFSVKSRAQLIAIAQEVGLCS